MADALVVGEIRGRTSLADVERWAETLRAELAVLSTGSRAHLLVDMTGYAPTSIDVHTSMRTVVPRLLADHGMRPALAELFPDAPEVAVVVSPAVAISAIATVHHDVGKMRWLDEGFGTNEQRFFSDRTAADRWLASRAP